MTRAPAAGRWLTLLLVGLGIALTIGGPLFGRGVFLGTDLLERFDPWASTAPDFGEPDNYLRGDEVDVRTPARHQIAQGLRKLDLPLWQSEVNGGRPLGSVPNTSSLSPFNAPYWILPIAYAPAATKLLELLVAMLGTFALLRGHGVRRDVSVLGGFLVAFTGYQIVWTAAPVAPLAAMFPAMLWSVDFALRRRTFLAHLPLLVAVTTGWLQGFPALSVLQLVLAGAWSVFSLVGTRSVRSMIAPLAGLAGAVVLGTTLAMFQLGTFLGQLGGVDTGVRAQNVTDHLPLGHLLTTALPFAFGDLEGWRGVGNFVESHTWLGIVPLSLLGLWAWTGGRAVASTDASPALGALDEQAAGRARLGSFLATVAAVSLVLVWLGGLPLRLAQLTPLFSINDVARIRNLTLTAAVLLGALALDRLVSQGPAASRPGDRNPSVGWRWARAGVLAALAVGVVATGLPDAIDGARRAGSGGQLQADLAVAVVGFAVVGGLLWFTSRRTSQRTGVVALLVPALLAIAIADTVRLTRDVWPDVPREALYPSTPAHEFLAANLGNERTASAELALYPGTTTWYRIRTVAGHAFPTQQWAEALRKLDPGVYDRSATMPLLGVTPDIARSPLLDRLAARWWVTDLDHPPIGSPGSLELRRTEMGFTADLPADRPFRALVLPSSAGLVATVTQVTTTVLAAGEPVATSTRRLLPTRPERAVVLTTPDAVGDTLQITWTDAPELPGTLDAFWADDFDPLELVFSDGVVAYRRHDALARFRWATDAVVIADGGDRLDALSLGVPAGTVVLHDDALGDPSLDDTVLAGGGTAANLDVETADGDVLRINVEAIDDGWLVVADSLQTNWRATVDGAPATLLDADHVGVAVAVTAGEHDVELRYVPATLTWGRTVSLTTLLAIILLAFAPWFRRRRVSPEPGATP